MRRWAVLVAVLYGLVLSAIGLPGYLLAFVPKVGFSQAAGMYARWQWWLLLALMGVAQAALLAVPVRIASGRPVSRRPLALTVLTAALMMSGLVIGVACSIYEVALREHGGRWTIWTGLALGLSAWCAWAVIFFRMNLASEPEDFVSRLCKCLFKGSILELLIAVPTHIVARYRDYCCAGIMTFIGLTLGISVMLFSFGPGVFFLFAARWRQVHPIPKTRLEK